MAGWIEVYSLPAPTSSTVLSENCSFSTCRTTTVFVPLVMLMAGNESNVVKPKV